MVLDNNNIITALNEIGQLVLEEFDNQNFEGNLDFTVIEKCHNIWVGRFVYNPNDGINVDDETPTITYYITLAKKYIIETRQSTEIIPMVRISKENNHFVVVQADPYVILALITF